MKNIILNDALFMGKVTAGVTHDLQNVLAIIRETAGLLEDILLMNKDADLPFLDKFQNSLKTIGAQTERGAKVISTLNNFAHSPDMPVSEIDTVKSIDTLVSLIHRKVKTKNVTIQIETHNDPVMLRTDPIKYHAVVFLSIECILEQIKAKDSIHISSKKSGDSVNISFCCSGNLPDDDTFRKTLSASVKWTELENMCAAINAKIVTENKICGIDLDLSSLS